MRALVYASEPHDFARLSRTLRSLAACNVEPAIARDAETLAQALSVADEPLWLVRAGAWQTYPVPMRAIPPSASGRPLIGLGASTAKGCPSIYLDPEPARVLSERISTNEAIGTAIDRLARSRAFRCIPLHDIHARFDANLRVVQLVTTIQIGGAERVTLDLAEESNRLGIATVVAALSQPTRRSFPRPRFCADLSETPFEPEARAAAVERLCLEWGADIVHAHLIRANEAEAIQARGIPLVVTVHNMPAAWPAGYRDAGRPFADLVLGCAEAVSREVSRQLPATPVRTVWNGIDSGRALKTHRAAGTSAFSRSAVGWGENDFVLLSVANPRRQKRLERLPEIVARLQQKIAPRKARLILAGEHAAQSEDGREAATKLVSAAEQWKVQEALHWTGAIDDVAPLLAASDALVSTSDLEGMSLAQLEALAAGLPIVATDVGGASEIASRSDRMLLLPPDTDASAFANSLARLAGAPPARVPALPKGFTRERMTARAQLLYRGVLVGAARQRNSPRPVWLITNNFSTGGAQSSARRLLVGLAEHGHHVRGATIEESPQRLSPGRRALKSAGIRVTAISPSSNPEVLVAELLDAMTADAPHAVVFWNLITPVKVLLADALTGIPIYDVSPGEMYFQSLDRFFAAVPPGLPVLDSRAYGRRLAGVVVKFAGEAARAEEALRAPLHIIPNGIPLPALRERLARKRLVISTAARISPDKRLDQLLHAVRLADPRLPPYELRIAGGPDSQSAKHFKELRRLARGLPVKWLGHMDDPAELLAQTDIFAMISEPAGCPNASLEAMAHGRPIIATDHGGAAEQVIDGVNGRLVPRADVQAFANALIELASDAHLRLEMGAASRERAASTFSMLQMLNAYSELLELPPLRRHLNLGPALPAQTMFVASPRSP